MNASKKSIEEPQTYVCPPYFQNRELSWLEFNKRVLDQARDKNVPLLERLNFVSIFWSNLQEFFMVRVGSLTDLALVKEKIIDNKSGWTPQEQLDHIYTRVHELYPYYEETYLQVCKELAEVGVKQVANEDLTEAQIAYLNDWYKAYVKPFLSPQIVNSRHPFPHLNNGDPYVVVRLNEKNPDGEKKDKKDKKAKSGGAKNVTLGIIPLPAQTKRIVELPADEDDEGFKFILLENLIDMHAEDIFSMYKVKHTNIICVTRNADLDVIEGEEEQGDDFREHMKKILKKRSRLHPVRLESARPLSETVAKTLTERLELEDYQTFVTKVPLEMSFTYSLASCLKSDELKNRITNVPFDPVWPNTIDKNRSIINQATERELLLSYPYESMDPLIRLLKEAAVDPAVVSIKITLYRLASRSQLAEALIEAAENGKEVTALFELRARFDEFNNIEWSQRFEEAGCNVIYGFREYKVHSKICSITRNTPDGTQYITQLGTGNYNEKTAKLYTDLCFITTDEAIGKDAVAFFQNMQMEMLSDEYKKLEVAPLQIKQNMLKNIDEQIENKKAGKPSGIFLKTNSVTDEDVIEKLVEASQAGVECTLLVRGISCIVPCLENYTENICVVSIVGRLLEHSRIYCFGPLDGTEKMYLSSADLMTRNLNKRVEIAWPIENAEIKHRIEQYIETCLSDTDKLRALKPDGTYTELGFFEREGEAAVNSQQYLIDKSQKENTKQRPVFTPEQSSAKTVALNNPRLEALDKKIEAAISSLSKAKPGKAEVTAPIAKTEVPAETPDTENKTEEPTEPQTIEAKLDSSVPTVDVPTVETPTADPNKTQAVDVRKLSEMKEQAKQIRENYKLKASAAAKTESIEIPEVELKEKSKREEDKGEQAKAMDDFLKLFPEDNEFHMPEKEKKKKKWWK